MGCGAPLPSQLRAGTEVLSANALQANSAASPAAASRSAWPGEPGPRTSRRAPCGRGGGAPSAPGAAGLPRGLLAQPQPRPGRPGRSPFGAAKPSAAAAAARRQPALDSAREKRRNERWNVYSPIVLSFHSILP